MYGDSLCPMVDENLTGSEVWVLLDCENDPRAADALVGWLLVYLICSYVE